MCGLGAGCPALGGAWTFVPTVHLQLCICPVTSCRVLSGSGLSRNAFALGLRARPHGRVALCFPPPGAEERRRWAVCWVCVYILDKKLPRSFPGGLCRLVSPAPSPSCSASLSVLGASLSVLGAGLKRRCEGYLPGLSFAFPYRPPRRASFHMLICYTQIVFGGVSVPFFAPCLIAFQACSLPVPWPPLDLLGQTPWWSLGVPVLRKHSPS